jgi:hypothetical protein
MTGRPDTLDQLCAVARKGGFVRGMSFALWLVTSIGPQRAINRFHRILTDDAETQRIADLDIEAAKAEAKRS